MKIYEVLNYFGRSRYFVSAASEEEILDMVDDGFLKTLNTDPDLVNDYDEDIGERQYDDLRNSREEE